MQKTFICMICSLDYWATYINNFLLRKTSFVKGTKIVLNPFTIFVCRRIYMLCISGFVWCGTYLYIMERKFLKMMGLWQCPSHLQYLCDKQVFFALAGLSGVVWLVDLKHREFISHSFEYCFVRCQIQAWDQLIACHEHWGQVWGSWPIDMFLIPCYEILLSIS